VPRRCARKRAIHHGSRIHDRWSCRIAATTASRQQPPPEHDWFFALQQLWFLQLLSSEPGSPHVWHWWPEQTWLLAAQSFSFPQPQCA
jgi:hypothetical protein